MKFGYKNLGVEEQFEQFNTFYKHVGPFYAFRTGELGLHAYEAQEPAVRKNWTEFNLAITSTSDGNFTFVDADQTLVPQAWLTDGGQQLLLVDYDLMRAYRLEGHGDMQTARDKVLPVHLRQTAVRYFAAGQEPAYHTQGVELSKPDTALRKMAGKDAWVKEVLLLAKTRVQLLGLGDAWRYYTAHTTTSEPVMTLSPTEFVSQLKDDELCGIARKGLAFSRIKTHVPYLEIR